MFGSSGPGSIFDQATAGGSSLLDQYSSKDSPKSVFDRKESSGSIFDSPSNKGSVFDNLGGGSSKSIFDTGKPKGGSIFDTMNIDHGSSLTDLYSKGGPSTSSPFDALGNNNSSPFDALGNHSLSNTSPYDNNPRQSSPFEILGNNPGRDHSSSFGLSSRDASPFDVMSNNNQGREVSPFDSLGGNQNNGSCPENTQYQAADYKKAEYVKDPNKSLFNKDKPKMQLTPSVKLERKEEPKEGEENKESLEEENTTSPWKGLDKKHVISRTTSMSPSLKETQQIEKQEDSAYKKKIIEVAEQMSDEKLIEVIKKLEKEMENNNSDMKLGIKKNTLLEVISGRKKPIKF